MLSNPAPSLAFSRAPVVSAESQRTGLKFVEARSDDHAVGRVDGRRRCFVGGIGGVSSLRERPRDVEARDRRQAIAVEIYRGVREADRKVVEVGDTWRVMGVSV